METEITDNRTNNNNINQDTTRITNNIIKMTRSNGIKINIKRKEETHIGITTSKNNSIIIIIVSINITVIMAIITVIMEGIISKKKQYIPHNEYKPFNSAIKENA